MAVYSLIVNGNKIGLRNFANLYDGVLIASSMGLKDGQMVVTGFFTLASPCNISGQHPTGEIFLKNILVRPSLSGKVFKNVF